MEEVLLEVLLDGAHQEKDLKYIPLKVPTLEFQRHPYAIVIHLGMLCGYYRSYSHPLGPLILLGMYPLPQILSRPYKSPNVSTPYEILR